MHDYYNNGFYLQLPPYTLNLEVLMEPEIMRTVLPNLTDTSGPGGDT